MAGIVKFTVVRQQCLDPERIGIVVLTPKPAPIGDKAGVILAYATIVTAFLPVDGHVAKYDANRVGGFDNFISPVFAVAQIGGLLPRVAKQIAGDRQLGKNNYFGLLLLGPGNH